MANKLNFCVDRAVFLHRRRITVLWALYPTPCFHSRGLHGANVENSRPWSHDLFRQRRSPQGSVIEGDISLTSAQKYRDSGVRPEFAVATTVKREGITI